MSAIQGIGPSAITIAFSEDVQKLVKMGALVEKGGTLVQGAGLGVGAVALFQHHPAVGLAAWLVGSLINHGAKEYKTSQVQTMKQKWSSLFERMNQQELMGFVVEVRRYYPNTIAALHSTVLGNNGLNALIGSV